MLQHLYVLLVLSGSKLNTVFEVLPHQCWVQEHKHLPTPAGHTIPDTSRTTDLGSLIQPVQIHLQSLPTLKEIKLPPNLVSSGKLWREHSIPSSRTLIKMLNKTGPNTERWGTPDHQMSLTWLTTTLWAQPFSQFFIQQSVHPSKPWAAYFFRRMLISWSLHPRMFLIFTLPTGACLMVSMKSSRPPLLYHRSGSCHWCTPWTAWIAYVTLCCLAGRYCVGWRPPWGP